MLISATALLAANPDPTDDEIRAGLSGNLCRCTGYVGIVAAVRSAAASWLTPIKSESYGRVRVNAAFPTLRSWESRTTGPSNLAVSEHTFVKTSHEARPTGFCPGSLSVP